MGLDMYAFTTRQKPAMVVDFVADDAAIEVHYWRKHPNLHGWMEQLYLRKDGSSECFNLVNVALSRDDLDELEHAIRSGTLPYTSGFFFGKSDGQEYLDDLTFVAKAREAIAVGLTVFYSSWW
jgi:hypothetical protein